MGPGALIGPLWTMLRSRRAAWRGRGRPGILHVLHDRGGGTEKFLLEVVDRTRDRYRHSFLRILDDRWRVTDPLGAEQRRDFRWRTAGGAESGMAHFDYPKDAAAGARGWLAPVCAWLGIEFIHVHSLVGSGDDLLALLRGTALPYGYTAHDMYLPCPTVYLIDADGRYCNATTDIAICSRCLDAQGFRVDIAAWRQRYGEFLGHARKVWAPSAWARDTLRTYFPGLAVDVTAPEPNLALRATGLPSQQGFDLPDDGRRNIAVLGAIGAEKGARLIDAMADRIRARGLPLRLIVIGYTDRSQRYLSDDGVLAVHGPYQVADVARWLDFYRIGLVAFPTVWPETFGYTLSECLAAGRPALVPPRGALAERVAATGAGWIVERWPDPDAMIDRCLQLTAPEAAEALAQGAARARGAADAERNARAVPHDPYARVLGRPQSRHGLRLDVRTVRAGAVRAARSMRKPRPEQA
jgi:glycosyltransferase involved in cell wall biosynthesis